jgi:cytochrome c553
MRRLLLTATAVAVCTWVGAAATAQAADEPPPWAYGFTAPPPPNTPRATPGQPQPQDNVQQHSLEGSQLKFTRAQIANRFGPADWYPGDHPTMPLIVQRGKQDSNVFACSLCHYPNGKGRPENANVTGLTYEYIRQTLADFKNGARKTSDPRKVNTGLMEHFAKSMTDAELDAAAKYFASIPATPWIKVVETDMVPKTKPQGGMFLVAEGADAGQEPIAGRIIETPISAHDTEFLRNPRSSFTAYVPTGSLKKGEALVREGTTASGKKVTACTICHGPDLRGLGPLPTLAGRSPSYLARQLYDMQHGNRNGAWTVLMAPVVAGLSSDDVLNASAYLASLQP